MVSTPLKLWPTLWKVLCYFFRYPGKTLRLLIRGVPPGSGFGARHAQVRIRNRVRHLIAAADESRAHLLLRNRLHSVTAALAAERLADIRWPPFRPVPKSSSPQKIRPAARLICFYLPQFHPIPENDRWWGAGFTEWTNVRPAQPQFEGHYQPHVPIELGYYDLRDTETQRRQIELAKMYGIAGFCFYFYWFAGTRLLETPLRNYLADASLDLPFCLCWANENWTRRWDGLDKDILIQQQHAAEDDLAFISYISEYLQDPRYIRIDSKPLVIVYRPSLLPSPQATAQRWRSWCRANGVGEIHLAYTQSFERVDPAEYGFDSAIEFPPNNSFPPTIKVRAASEDFAGTVCDWSVFPQRSRRYEAPSYRLFRGVNPSWDNTARRKNRAAIFVKSSPCAYQEWLVNAIADSRERLRSDEERLIFINAWNEWAEGAHLEPDERHGFAYLEATRVAHVRAGVIAPQSEVRTGRGLAIIVHAFYADVFKELAVQLSEVLPIFGGPVTVFVSTTEQLENEIRSTCSSVGIAAHIFVVPNRGRDIWPFLHVLRSIALDDFDLVLKLHTKKSLHRTDGEMWRNDLISKLLDTTIAGDIRDFFRQQPGVGYVGPDGHIANISDYWGSNQSTVLDVGRRLGVEIADTSTIKFIAGTMFYCQPAALLPILNIALDRDCFEDEAGQIDGTLAHAIERCFALSAFAVGMTIASTADVLRNARGEAKNSLSLQHFYRAGR